MNKKLSKKIKESFVKNPKFLCYIIFSVGFSLIILCISSTLIFFAGNFLKKNIKEIYGNYHYSILDLDKDTAIKVAEDEKCFLSGIFQIEMTEENYLVYCEEEYLDLDGIEIIRGKFPNDGKSILCSKSYLYQQGYSDDEMIGAKVEINGKEYMVTGVINSTSFNELDYNGALIIYNLKYKFNRYLTYNILIENKSDDFKSDMNYFISKYNLNEKNLYTNEAYLKNAYRDSNNRPTGYLRIAYIILFFVCASVLTLSFSVIMLSNQQIGKELVVYNKIGIGIDILTKTYMVLVIKIMLEVLIIVNLLNMLVCHLFYREYNSVKFQLFNILFQVIVYFLPTVAFNIYLFKKNIKDRNTTKIKISLKDYNARNKLISGKNLSIQLARQNNVFGKLRSFGIVVTLFLSGTIFICAFFYSKQIKQQLIETNKYDFTLSYTSDEWDKEGADEYLKNIEIIESQIKKIENTEFVPLYTKYNEEILVNKKNLSKEFQDVLSKADPNLSKQIKRSSKMNIKINAIFVGIRNSECKAYGLAKDDIDNLKENECIVIGNVKISNNIFVNAGLESGDFLTSFYYDENNKLVNNRIKIKKTYENMKIKLTNAEYQVIVIVKVDELARVVHRVVPYTIFIKCDYNEKDKIIDIVKGNRNINLIDIQESNKKYLELNRLIKCIATIILCIITSFAVINIWLVLKVREKEIRRQCTTLKILGLSDNRVIFVYLYDIVKILIYGAVTSIVFSVILCYQQVKNTYDIRIFIKYYVPYNIYVILIAFYTMCCSVFVLLLKKKLRETNIIQEMKSIER